MTTASVGQLMTTADDAAAADNGREYVDSLPNDRELARMSTRSMPEASGAHATRNASLDRPTRTMKEYCVQFRYT